MKKLLCLTALLFARTSDAALLSLTHATTTPSALTVVTSFTEPGHPSDWVVRDGSYAYEDDSGFLFLGYTSDAPGVWRPRWNFALPLDGSLSIDLYGGGINKFDMMNDIDFHGFVAADDTSVQLILPTSRPYNLLTFVSSHMGVISLTYFAPEPPCFVLALLASLSCRSRRHG